MQDQNLENPNKKKFPLIPIVVSLTVVGILAAIALPSFFNQNSKARGAEARIYIISAINVQQKNYKDTGRFIPSWNELGIGVSSSSNNYEYQVSLRSNNIAIVTATAKKEGLNGFTGIAIRNSNAQICQAMGSMKPPEIERITDAAIECPSGSTSVVR